MLKRSWIILVVLSLLGLMALPIVAYAHDEPQNCPEPGVDDNRHPSGKDRSCESGSSMDGSTGGDTQTQEDGAAIQGRSESDPDDNGRGPERSNGGGDKPNGGPGGLDHADQDSNNGCGNDDDFEDDNEGWCGGKPKPLGDQGFGALGGPDVLGAAFGKGAHVGARSQAQGRADEAGEVRSIGGGGVTEVLGERFVRSVSPTLVLGVEFVRGQIMAVTGSPLGVLVQAALTFLGIGTLLLRRSRVSSH